MIDSRSDLRNLENFYYIAKLGTFQAAAQKLCTTQPAISQRISLLEEALGQRLFSRSTRRVSLTSKGRELLLHAEDILQRYQNMNMAVGGNTHTMRGTLRLSVGTALTHTPWFPYFMQKISEVYPELNVEPQVDIGPVARAKMANQQADLIFMMSITGESDISCDSLKTEQLPLCQYPLSWVCGPKLDINPSSLSLKYIENIPFISYLSDSDYHAWTQRLFNKSKIKQPDVYFAPSQSVMLDMAEDSLGLSIFPPAIISKQLARNELQVLNVVDGPTLPSFIFTANWLPGPGSHAAREVAQIAQQVANEKMI